MQEPNFFIVAMIAFFSVAMIVAGLYLLAKFKTLFKRQIKNELLRKNIVSWMIAMCVFLALTPTNHDFSNVLKGEGLPRYFLLQILCITIGALFVFNITLAVIKYSERKNYSFRKSMIITLAAIIASTMVIAFPINYVVTGSFATDINYRLLFNFYTASMAGFVYITMSYVDMERKRKLDEKELEVARLQQLKTRAELDALHSKINPHFLYNALNSIADLSITDGGKARKMTIALADLFRYSINYGDNNYSTIKEEIEMATVYLEIEKIRFEDKLNFSLQVDEELNYYLVPRFVLQPLVENAVKHGLKATGKMTEIQVEVKRTEKGMALIVADNGPAFPGSLMPGYGVKSVYDKLDMLFPENYELHFSNEPRKQVTIYINKLMKNEGAI
jgi:two-component system LytT family sensor kinase